MKLTHIMGARLTLDSDEQLILERIGKGMFHTCYADQDRRWVYAITIDRKEGSDFSKEILSRCEQRDHLPPVRHLGDLGDRRVYRMPFYAPLKAAHKEAWGQFRILESARMNAWKVIFDREVQPRRMRVSDVGYMVNEMVCDMVQPLVPRSLWESLEELKDTASEYGTGYCFEFSRRNCMVTPQGTLVLLDCLFSLEVVEDMQNARRKNGQ